MSQHRHSMLTAFAFATAILIANLPTARAQSAQDKAAAQALFDEGLRLFNAGDYPQACAKLEASLALVNGIGTRGKLAECYEKVGRTASAWAAWREVSVLSGREGQTQRQQIAAERARQLEPSLAYLTINLPAEGRPRGLEVARSGASVAAGAFGTAIAVDPGTHAIEVSAPGHVAWSTTVEVAPASRETVDVPPLEKAPEAPAPPSVSPDQPAGADRGPTGPNVRRIAGISAVAAGGVFVAVGVGFGIKARSDYNDAFDRDLCDDDNLCNDEGLDLTDGAHTKAMVANVFVIGGVVAAGVGTWLWLTSGREPDDDRTVRLTPAAGPSSIGVSLDGRF